MFVLYETASGYALFKVRDSGKITETTDLTAEFSTTKKAQDFASLVGFQKFSNTTEALSAATAMVEGKMDKSLKEFLKSNFKKGVKEQLAVQDAKLGTAIKEKLNVSCISGAAVVEVFRGLRSKIDQLIPGLAGTDLNAMALGLSHSLSRYKLKFSPDKVDTMIVQAIALLDMLDKELNVFSMRVREWYGWHFPELAKIVQDNQAFARVVKKMGTRNNAANTDLSDVVPPEMEEDIKEAAKISMGTEISNEDTETILDLCDQVLDIAAYREELSEYLKNRMHAIAPNLTLLVGELVGARLIAHAGSLMNLAKHPASTVQILGAEKALFRALKTKHETPKYGLIYHASLIGQTTQKNKGKISRLLAAKCALSCRVDALGEKDDEILIGSELRDKVMNRIRAVDGKMPTIAMTKIVKASSNVQKQPKKVDHKKENGAAKTTQIYNAGADTTLSKDTNKKEKKDKKEKKSKKEEKNGGVAAEETKEVEKKKEDSKKDKKKKEKKEKEPKKDKEASSSSSKKRKADGDDESNKKDKKKAKKAKKSDK